MIGLMDRQAATSTMSPMSAEEARFEAVFRANVHDVHRYATSRLGAAEGEDVTADVFHAAAVAFSDGRESQVTPAWLMAVTRNKVIDRWRKAERRNALAHFVRPRKDDMVTFPDDWAARPDREAVLAALDQLNPRHRSLLVLHYVDGMPAREIADVLGTSVSAVESRLARARRAFRTHYREERR